jgi:hypothetical protein
MSDGDTKYFLQQPSPPNGCQLLSSAAATREHAIHENNTGNRKQHAQHLAHGKIRLHDQVRNLSERLQRQPIKAHPAGT